MVIAWRSLLHACYRKNGVDYRLHEMRGKRRRFERTKSRAYKYWNLAESLAYEQCPLDKATKSNLFFLIGLRNEIEHHQSAGVDKRLSGRYLACCLNYERHLSALFGEKHSIGEAVAFTLQFRDLAARTSTDEAVAPLPSNVATYLREFDAELSEDELDSLHYQYRFLFVPTVTSKKAQADQVVEFVPFDSDLGKEIHESYQQILLKEVERPKHLPGNVVKQMRAEGYGKFGLHHHTKLWKELGGKNPGKGYGVVVDGTWYWYERWVDEVRSHCQQNVHEYVVPSNEDELSSLVYFERVSR